MSMLNALEEPTDDVTDVDDVTDDVTDDPFSIQAQSAPWCGGHSWYTEYNIVPQIWEISWASKLCSKCSA